jgi:hypothetical protein
MQTRIRFLYLRHELERVNNFMMIIWTYVVKKERLYIALFLNHINTSCFSDKGP